LKKSVMIGLLFAVLSLVSVSAETWEQFIQRAKIMEENFGEGFRRDHWSRWGNDKWGALMATAFWLEWAFEDIYRNAPISRAERDIYRRIWQRRRTMADDMERLLTLANLSNSNRRAVVNRWEHWERHLNNGGTIRFN